MNVTRRDILRNSMRYIVLALFGALGWLLFSRNQVKPALANCDYVCSNCPAAQKCAVNVSENSEF